MDASAKLVDGFLAADEPVYGVTTGFGSLATTSIPPERTAELQLALIRSHAAGMGARGRASRWCGPWCCCGPAAWPWAARVPARRWPRAWSPCSTPGSHRWSTSTARWAPAATWRRWPRRRWRSSARARCGTPAAPSGRRREALTEPPAWTRSTLRAKEGLALINGTDGILGMLVLALADLRRLLQVADITAAMTVEALLGTDRAFAADLQALRPQPGQAVSAGEPPAAARRLGHRRQPPRRRPPGAGRLLAALHAAGARRGPRHRCPRRARRRPRAGVGHRQPDDPARRPGGVLRELPRRAARPTRATSWPSPWPMSAPSSSAAPTGCSTAPGRTACRPFLAPGRRRRLRPDDRPLRPGRDGGREPPAGHAGLRRHHPDAAPCRRTTCRWGGAPPASSPGVVANLGRILAVELTCAARGPRPPGAADAGARARPRRSAAVRTVVGGPGPDRWLSPELAAVEDRW